MAQLPILTPSIVPNYSGGTAPIASPGIFTQGDQQLQRTGYQAQVIADDVLTRHLQLEQQTDDAMATSKALAFRDAKRKYLNPVDGLMSMKGGDAVGMADTAEKHLNKLAEEMAGGLQNDRQKTMFHHAIGLDLESSLNQVGSYEASSRDQFFKDTSKAVVDASIEDAVANSDNPNAQQIFLERMENEIRANPEGLPPQAVEFQVKSAISKVYSGTTEALAYRDPTAAMRYLNANKDKVLGTDRLHLEQAIDTGLRTRMAMQDHQLALQDKANKVRADALAKQGDELLSKGGLTAGWIEANKATLDEPDVRYFYNKLNNPDQPEVRDNPEILAKLWSDKVAGKDVSGDARDAMIGHQLSTSSYKQLTPMPSEATEPLDMRQAQAQLRAITAYSELNPTPAAAAAYGNANLDLNEWWQDTGSKLPPERRSRAALEQATAIGNRYRVTGLDAQRFTLRFPRSMQGSLGDSSETMANNLSVAIDKFQQDKGRMSEEERLDEADRLEKMRKNLEASGVKVPPPPSARKAAPPRPSSGAVPGVPGAAYGGRGSVVFGGVPPADAGAPAAGPTVFTPDGPAAAPIEPVQAPDAAPAGF